MLPGARNYITVILQLSYFQGMKSSNILKTPLRTDRMLSLIRCHAKNTVTLRAAPSMAAAYMD